MVTADLLQEFKDRMHITNGAEDNNLKSLLSFSISAIRGSCGDFDINGITEEDERARELVMERTRYAYNDALEFFNDNFLSQINSVGMALAFREAGDPVVEIRIQET